MVNESLAQKIAEEIAQAIGCQQTDFDNLGDNESIVFTERVPVINLNQIAEALMEKFSIGELS